MATSREHFALDWIKNDLLETLNQAHQCLEAYAEALEQHDAGAPPGGAAAPAPDAAQSSLQSCLNHLHQLHGTLVMLQLSGVTLLAEHLERVADALYRGRLDDAAGPSQSLMQGILELPGYLEELQAGLPDAVAPMLPLVNELRAHLGEPALGDESAVAGLSGETPDTALERFEAIDGTDKARRIRAVYQQVLLSLLKGEPLAGAVDTLRKVAQGLRRICEGTAFEGQWQAFGEFVASLAGTEAVAPQGAALDSDLVKLLRRVDAEIRDLAQNGTDALRKPVPIALVRQMLDAASARGHSSHVLAQLKEAASRYQQSDALSISARQALVVAAAALREELALVKDRLDLFVRSDARTLADLDILVGPLKQIGSTLSVLGFESSHTMVADQIERLNAMVQAGQADEGEILAAAGALVRVDENLASLGQGGKGEAQKITDAAQKAVALETRNGLDAVKQAIVDFVSAQWDVRHLREVPQQLRSLTGALRLIPLQRAAELLGDCEHYVRESLLEGHVPSWPELDLLADALSGIDYYLERLGGDNPAGAEEVLDVVARSLGELTAPKPEELVAVAAAVASEEAGETIEAEDAAAAAEADDAAAAAEDEIPALDSVVEEVDAEPAYGSAEEVDLSAIREGSEPELELEHDASFDLSNPMFDALALDAEAETAAADQGVGAEAGERAEASFPAEESGAVSAEISPEISPEVSREIAAEVVPEDSAEVVLEIAEETAADGSAELEVVPLDDMAAPEVTDEEPVADLAGSAEATVEPGDAGTAQGEETGAPAISPLAASLADNFDSDEDIVEIFIEEVGDVLAAIHEQLPPWEADLADESALTEIRRAFHTLKGSGRMVGANVLGEMAWSIENMLNRVMDGTVAATPDFLAVVREAVAMVPALRTAFESRQAPDMVPVGQLMEQADVLASGGDLTDAEERVGPVAAADTAEAAAAAELEETQRLFLAEAEEYLAQLEAAAQAEGFELGEAVLRALHTLSGSAAMAGIETIAEVVGPAYELAQALRQSGGETRLDGELDAFFRDLTVALAGMVRDVAAGDTPEEQFQLVAEADRLLMAVPDDLSESETLPGLPALEAVMNGAEFLETWQADAMDLARFAALQEALAEVVQVARDAGHHPVARLADVLRGAHERLESSSLGPQQKALLGRGYEALLKQVDGIAADQALQLDEDLVAQLETLMPAPDVQEPENPEEPPPGQVDAGDADAVGASDEQIIGEDVDPEIVEIFFEEAEELFETVDRCIDEWAGEPDNLLNLENLLRALHTLKGGARLAGMTLLGQRTHDFESFLIDFQGAAASADAALFDALHGWFDDLSEVLARTRAALAGDAPAAPNASGATAETTAPEGPSTEQATGSLEAGSVPEPDAAAFAEPAVDDDQTDRVLDGVLDEGADRAPDREAGKVARFPSTRPGVAGWERRVGSTGQEAAEAAAPSVQGREPSSSQEAVRVGASLLEELVNLAGESSIVRARIEQGMSDFTGALDEMETTIERLREQLRRLEIETEAQVLFRHDRADGPSYDDFDPLEMDRYSQLQQLSRALSESASDMLDLKETLLFKARESETLLLQQARLNTELQEGLMRTRMVPFSRLVPRLRRTVRQVSRELDKEVELHAFNVDGELDRNLLERMVPPLEHMLRNAVDHGIESPQERVARGKAASGRVDLRLSREGGDVVIEISDDGAGIDVQRVRAKAVERGLMARDADLGDDDISQFVLAPGFSTAESVTQISGRGVGMDVVHSEVKQLGGSIGISSRPGKGTRFVLRVPFTVSVNRALMVAVGEDLYAIPLNTIEGIVLLTPEELDKLYAPDGSTFEYAGVPYQVRYLGNFLGREYHAQGQRASVPLVLVRSGERAVAVHVDAVQGSREIVVKSLGPQFAGVGGISGATILGDGSVVVILDLLALIRSQAADGLASTRRPLAGAAQTRTVMVVDDSVTVRKVTSRLLERQGIDVMVAKDGVEAVALLQERRPDVMLLDIEMPRMDGFEVARQVRRDERLAELPIIMISSRTGEKHHQRALEIGVDRFLGKPFQENELLACIDELVS